MSEGTKVFNPQTEVSALKKTLADLIARVEKLEKASLPAQPYVWCYNSDGKPVYATEEDGTQISYYVDDGFDSDAAQKAFFERGE